MNKYFDKPHSEYTHRRGEIVVPMKRREFLEAFGTFAVFSILPHTRWLEDQIPDDAHEAICRAKLEFARSRFLPSQPISEIIVAFGESFIGAPYVPYTLESEGGEKLTVCLDGFDCVTLCENVLSLSRCVKRKRFSCDSFREELQYIRYRGGIIAEYPSRLHYFSDWIHDNEEKGIVVDITKDIGGIAYRKKIDFMSNNLKQYPQLRNAAFERKIRETEAEITKRDHYHILKDDLSRCEGMIMGGDIVAVTTSIKGLDISHTGIAVRQDGILKLLHVSQVGEKVNITKESLADYLQRNKKFVGVRIVRATEPILSKET